MTDTNHRAQADRLMHETAAMPDAVEHLLAAIHDLLAERLPKRSTDCPECGVENGSHRLDCAAPYRAEPKPLVSRDLTEMQERINATLTNPAVDAALNPGGHVGVTGVHEAGGCAECSEPEPESVTVTLPRDVVEIYGAKDWRIAAQAHRDDQFPVTADLLDAVADALDAAGATQEADQGGREAERDTLAARLAAVEALAAHYEAEARSEGYGGELWSTTGAAIRAALATGTTTNPQEADQ